MSNKTDPKELERALNKAKIGIMSVRNSVFISTILFSLRQSWTDRIPTAAVDGTNLVINPEWFMELSPAERIALLAHESWHVAFSHITRATDFKLDHRKYNRAADYVINIMLQDNNYKLPAGGLVDKAYRNMSTEQVYKVLPDDPEGDANYDCDIEPASEAEAEAISEAITNILVKAVIQSKMQGDEAGSIPGDIKRTIDDLLNPKLPWEVILQNYMSVFTKDDYSFRKPNRRYYDGSGGVDDHYLPSLYSESMAELAIAIDSSGSVMDSEFLAFLTEIHYIKENLAPLLTTIIDFDTTVKHVHKLTKEQTIEGIEFSGYGGTNLTPVFDYYETDKPTVLVIFSDLHCDKIQHDPGYPVIWIVINNPSAKVNFGKVIHYAT